MPEQDRHLYRALVGGYDDHERRETWGYALLVLAENHDAARALAAKALRLPERRIRVELDPGYEESRPCPPRP